MYVCLAIDEDGLHVTAEMTNAERTIHGTILRTLQPGDNFYGYTFDQLKALGGGGHDLKFPIPTAKQAS